MVVLAGRPGRGGAVCEGAAEPLLDARPEGRGAEVVDHELEPRPGARQPVAQVGAPDAEDRLEHRDRLARRHEHPEVVGQARERRQAAADPHPETRPAVPQRAEQGDAVDLRRVALVGAGRDGDLVLARQVGELRPGDEVGRGLRQQGPDVEQLGAVDAADRATGDVAHVVAAGAAAGQAHRFQSGEHLAQAGHLDPVQLDVLAGGELAVVAAEAARQLADGAQLERGENAAGDLRPQHEEAELGFVVVGAVPLEADHVLLRHRLVPGLDQGRQVVEDREAALLRLEPLDEVALVDQLPAGLDLRWTAAHRRQTSRLVALSTPPRRAAGAPECRRHGAGRTGTLQIGGQQGPVRPEVRCGDPKSASIATEIRGEKLICDQGNLHYRLCPEVRPETAPRISPDRHRDIAGKVTGGLAAGPVVRLLSCESKPDTSKAC